MLIVSQSARLSISAFSRSSFSTAPMLLITHFSFVLHCRQFVVSLLAIACSIDYLFFAKQTISVLPALSFALPLIIEIEVKRSLDPFLSLNYLPPTPYL